MHRFYPGCGAAVAVAMLVAGSARAQEQTSWPSNGRPPLGASFTVDALGTLPSSASIFPLLTSIADVIGDRIDTGGISAGAPARVGAHGSTWTQTTYRVGDADITNLSGTGTPLLMPGVDVWERVDVSTGLMPIDVDAPAMAVTLTPRRPGSTTLRSIELFGSPPFANAGSATDTPPSIARLNSGARANLFMGGQLTPDRLSGLVSATWIRSSYSERDSTKALTGTLGSVFANVTSTPKPGDEIRIIGWGQRASDAAPHHVVFNSTDDQHVAGLHMQAAWQHQIGDSDGLRVFTAYTLAHRSTDLVAPGVVVIDRLKDGPVPSLLDPGIGTDRTWALGARLNRTRGIHNLLGGVDLSGGTSSVQSVFTGRVGETLNGLPARVWDFTDPAQPSNWSERSFTAFISDHFAVGSRVTVDGGLRLEAINGSGTGNDTSINWLSLLPRAGFHWTMLNFWDLGAFGSYGRYGHRLPLNDLAYGDPSAPTANIYRWNATVPGIPQPGQIGPLVQRLGPGTGGVAGFSSIDPSLKRPYLDELVLGFDARPSPRTYLRIAAMGRRETNLVSVSDVGVPESTYSTIQVPDMGIDVVGTQDDTLITFYNRSPSTFGADRYLLTNPAGDDANFVGADMIGTMRTDKFFFFLGLTAGRSEGIAANRGFGPLENDDGLVGEAYVNPNALGHAQGRTFTERGYTIKTAATYTFPHDLTLGVIGRYQDGQHFARMVIYPDLNQGAEAVRAFRNGRTRFTFEMTVDTRLQKGFTVGGHRADVFLEAYNLFNEYLEVEEDTVSGPTSRMKTASQPPRAIYFGVRVPF